MVISYSIISLSNISLDSYFITSHDDLLCSQPQKKGPGYGGLPRALAILIKIQDF